MKKTLSILAFLHFALFAVAQTFESNKIVNFSDLYERIDFFDEEGQKTVSVAPKFYKQYDLKKRMKPIKVNDQSYFIQIEKFGMQSVYTDEGEQVAEINRNDSNILMLQTDKNYRLKPKIKLGNMNILEWYDADGNLVSKILWNKDRKLAFYPAGDQDPDLLLMALCAHQYQELLLGDRGRLSSAVSNNLFNTLMD